MGNQSSQARKARLRRAVYPRDNFTCRDCDFSAEPPDGWSGEGIYGLTLGHIIPKAWGGGNAIDNLIVQCLACNTELDDRRWEPDWREHYPQTVDVRDLRNTLSTEVGRLRRLEEIEAEWREFLRDEAWSPLHTLDHTPSTPDDE